MTPTQPVNQPTPLLSDMTSPYRGLSPYTEADAAYFFGRTTEIATITANLEVTRFTLFYGPSGVGKSSVLRAGVIHQLTQRAQETFAATGVAEQIPVYFSRWASDPLLGLSQALAAAVAPYVPPPNLPFGGAHVEAQVGGGTDVLSTDLSLPPLTGEGWGGGSLLDQLHHWSQATGSELLLVLDQFEEFFQYHVPQPGATWDPTGFGAQLVQIINHSTLPVNVLLSLREDALARLDYFQGRIPGLLDNRLSLGHLDRSAGREAIREPLAQYNREHQTTYTLEDGLVSAVLDQVGSGQVALSRQDAGVRNTDRIEAPYLQLVLTRLWQQEQSNGSTHLCQTTLDELGGAATIVRNYLDDTLAALSPAKRDLAARFFDRLVTPSGTKIALSLAELAYYAGVTLTKVEALAQQLQDRRLLRSSQSPTGETQYEIFHDVLGPALLDWQERYLAEVAEAERLAKEQAARKAAEERTQVEQRTNQRLRRLVGALAIVLLVAIVTAFFAAIEARLVTGFSLTLEARNFVRDQNLRMATLLALEARKLNSNQGTQVLASEIPLQVPYIRTKPMIGHGADVLSVAWRPDGQQLVSTSRDHTVIIWDAISSKPITLFRDPSAVILSAAWRSDGQQLALVSSDNTVIIWDVTSSGRVATLRGHSDDVLSVTWRPDGQQLASASSDNTVIIWDVTSRERVTTLRGHNDDVRSVAWRPDGQQLASASSDNTVIIWDASSGERMTTFHGHNSAVLSVAWRPDGQQLASASWDNSVIIWNVASSERLIILRGHSDDVRSVAWRPDGQQLASASSDNTVIIWDASSGERMTTFHSHNSAVLSVAWRPDGQQLASASSDKTVIIWDITNGGRVAILRGHTDVVLSVAWRPDGQQLASGSSDNTMIIWDANSGKQLMTLRGHSDDVRSVAWRPDGRQLASASSDNTVIIWDAINGRQMTTFRGHSSVVRSVAWRPDGQQLASASSDKTVIIWDASNAGQVVTLLGHSDSALSVAWRPDGQQLASGSSDNTVIIWDANSGKQLMTLRGHSDDVRSVAWRPDGRQLASASSDNTVIIWDVNNGERITTLHGHSAAVLSVAWQPDGRQLASVSWDNSIMIWNVVNNEQVATLRGHRNDVWSVAWRPNGQQLASASSDNTILIYPYYYLKPPCDWAWSNLTPDEWLRYRGWAIYRPTCPMYVSLKMPSAMIPFDKWPGYLLISWSGRLFFGGVLLAGLLIIALPIWGVGWLVRRFLRKRRQRRLAAPG